MRALGPAAFLLLLPACAPPATKLPYTSYRHGDPDARPEVMETQMFEFAATFAGEVEGAADRISEASDDLAIRRRALTWKIHAIPAAQMACFRRDPLAAALDMWILCAQMEDFFTDGTGSTLFGPQQPIAIETSQWLLAKMTAIIGTFTRTAESVATIERDVVEPWVRRHPIQSLLFTRDSTIALYVELAKETGHDAFASVRTLEELAIDLTRQVRVYAAQLPKQARWHAELVRQETLESERVQVLVDHLSRLEDLARTAERGVAHVEGLTAELDRQSEAILTLIDEERTAIMDGVAEERAAVLDRITEERLQVLRAIDVQRQATLEWLGDEREAVATAFHEALAALVEILREERAATMAEVDTLATAAVAQSGAELDAVVDHAFWRLIQLLLVAVVAAPFVARVYRFVLRRRA